MKTTPDRIKALMVEQLGVEAELVRPSAKFTEDLGADSLDMVELVMALEQEFAVNITDEVADGFSTVGDVIQFIESQPHA